MTFQQLKLEIKVDGSLLVDDTIKNNKPKFKYYKLRLKELSLWLKYINKIDHNC